MNDNEIVREALKAKGWEKRWMWSLPAPTPEVLQAVASYMVRSLSRGRIPDAVLVERTVNGEEPVPGCGYLGCSMDPADHVH